MLEAAFAKGLEAADFRPTSAGLITTPGLAWLAMRGQFDLAVMVSASHNPAVDNGIKIFGASGAKLSSAEEAALEARLAERGLPASAVDGADAPDSLVPDLQLELDYLSFLVDSAGKGLDLHGLRIVIDCANGGASRVFPRVLGRLGAQVSTIHAEPDGENINRECGSTQPASLQSEVLSRSAALGVAVDGDGDRCILVDEHGQLVNGDSILALVARHAMERGEWKDPRVVATVMSNKGLHRALREAGCDVVTVDVGDRQVVEALRRERLPLGGEQSGHIVFGADHDYIGDGIYTALRVLRILRERAAPLSRLAAVYQPFPQVLRNVPVSSKPHLSQIPRLASAVQRIESELGEDGRVLLRYSGTEPLARVMIEGPDAERIRNQAQELAELIEREIGAP
jgi:phosphoglucosamine mutase